MEPYHWVLIALGVCVAVFGFAVRRVFKITIDLRGFKDDF